MPEDASSHKEISREFKDLLESGDLSSISSVELIQNSSWYVYAARNPGLPDALLEIMCGALYLQISSGTGLDKLTALIESVWEARGELPESMRRLLKREALKSMSHVQTDRKNNKQVNSEAAKESMNACRMAARWLLDELDHSELETLHSEAASFALTSYEVFPMLLSREDLPEEILGKIADWLEGWVEQSEEYVSTAFARRSEWKTNDRYLHLLERSTCPATLAILAKESPPQKSAHYFEKLLRLDHDTGPTRALNFAEELDRDRREVLGSFSAELLQHPDRDVRLRATRILTLRPPRKEGKTSTQTRKL